MRDEQVSRFLQNFVCLWVGPSVCGSPCFGEFGLALGAGLRVLEEEVVEPAGAGPFLGYAGLRETIPEQSGIPPVISRMLVYLANLD